MQIILQMAAYKRNIQSNVTFFALDKWKSFHYSQTLQHWNLKVKNMNICTHFGTTYSYFYQKSFNAVEFGNK